MEYIDKRPKIFILSGKAKSGKNKVADLIEKYYVDKKCIQISFASYLKQYTKKITDWNGNEDTKPREFLQSLGIDLIKTKIDSNLLIRRICEDIKIYSYFFDIIIITDARLIDEIEVLKKEFNKVITFRIIRTNYNDYLTDGQRKHITETNLDIYKNFDYYIDNKNDLKSSLYKILKEISYE